MIHERVNGTECHCPQGHMPFTRARLVSRRTPRAELRRSRRTTNPDSRRDPPRRRPDCGGVKSAEAIEIECADLGGHEVDKHTGARWQVLSVQVTDVVAAIVGCICGQRYDEFFGNNVIADLVAGHLRNARTLQNRVQDQVGIVECEMGRRQVFPYTSIELELPFENPPAGEAEVDAIMPA